MGIFPVYLVIGGFSFKETPTSVSTPTIGLRPLVSSGKGVRGVRLPRTPSVGVFYVFHHLSPLILHLLTGHRTGVSR